MKIIKIISEKTWRLLSLLRAAQRRINTPVQLACRPIYLINIVGLFSVFRLPSHCIFSAVRHPKSLKPNCIVQQLGAIV